MRYPQSVVLSFFCCRASSSLTCIRKSGPFQTQVADLLLIFTDCSIDRIIFTYIA